jgi:hypothetical protein
MAEAMPELILKKRFYINSTGDQPYPAPELLIVGNKEGLLWLAAQLQRQAQSTNTSEDPRTDPDDHRHISTMMPEVNRELSDEMELRIGLIDDRNREADLQKYRITPETRKVGSLIGQYESDIELAREAMEKHTRL